MRFHRQSIHSLTAAGAALAICVASAGAAAGFAQTRSPRRAVAAPPEVTKVRFRPTREGGEEYQARVGDVRLTVYAPDHPSDPTSWESGLTVENLRTRKRYETDVSLIEDVYVAPRARLLIVVSGGRGGETSVSFLDVRTGAARSPRLDFVTEGVEVEGRRLIVSAECEGSGGAARRCHSARVYRLNAQWTPDLQEDESVALTKRQLGVGFFGVRTVRAPRTPDAALAP
jgi:hypothetical protein